MVVIPDVGCCVVLVELRRELIPRIIGSFNSEKLSPTKGAGIMSVGCGTFERGIVEVSAVCICVSLKSQDTGGVSRL